MEEIEWHRYEPKPIRVLREAGEEVEATTFLVKDEFRRDGLWTSAAYVGHIVTGLRAHGVAEDYIQHVIDVALETNRRSAERAAEESRLTESLRHPASSGNA